MEEIKIFKNSEFGSVRTVMVNDEPYFIGKDVASILGYGRPTKAISDNVDKEDIDEVPIEDSIGRMQKTPIINESGLYSLILSSKLPTAKKFKRWVTSEVLPSIRKHGAYMTKDTLKKAMLTPDFIVQLATQLKSEQEKVKQLQPKASYCDVILNTPDLISTTVIAKDYGKSAIWLNDYLNAKGIQYKQSGTWVLYQKYANKGLTSTKTTLYSDSDGTQHSKIHTYWTAKGREFIYELLKSDGFLPRISKENALEELFDMSGVKRQNRLIDAFIDTGTDWKRTMLERIKSICDYKKISYSRTMRNLYRALESGTGCNLDERLKSTIEKMKSSGRPYCERKSASKLDAIADDIALKARFEIIVKGI